MNKLFCLLLAICTHDAIAAQPLPSHNLRFDSLATRWDEGIPLGNGWLGALIWKKGNNVRLSLDRVDLWDDRPMPEIDKLNLKWVEQKVKMQQYDSVQKYGDEPYEKFPAPTKIPGAALEFNCSSFGKIVSNELDISIGLSTIVFENGVQFFNYVHASKETGYFGFEKLPSASLTPQLMIPAYNTGNTGGSGNSVEGQGLERLGYKKGTVTKTATSILYHQPTWNNNYYEVLVQWKKFTAKHIIGQWTITVNKPAVLSPLIVSLKEPTGWDKHIAWWQDYWSRSSVTLPDSMLEKQYYLEMYKFGSVARSNTPPISLQAVWTADNGNLPPWKGDLHHDLNTQLSYWPGYTSNHTDLTASYTNWLWKVKDTNKKWTKHFFETDGLNVPGVTTISGKAMGGWVQYSMSPTTSAWLAQHFYWQWKYTGDKKFLQEKCKPYFDEIDKYFSQLHLVDSSNHKFRFPLSSSPEYNDNTIKAWFTKFTNYDLSLVRNFYSIYNEVEEKTTGIKPHPSIKESRDYPGMDTNETGLTIAPGQNLDESHRHHAHLMAIYPLGMLSPDDSAQKKLIDRSLNWLANKGTRNWCGYSFSWAACLYARAKQADSAARMLNIFASNFCSPNSFHLNGDQKGGQYSSFTYRPFTLEGNFAFAQGVHEMLVQSYNGYIEVFPAVPKSWPNVTFQNLRTEGAFLVSAQKTDGVVTEVVVEAEQDAELHIRLPFKTWLVTGIEREQIGNAGGNIQSVHLKQGQTIIFKNGYE